MRYYVKCKIKPEDKLKLANSIRSGNLAKGKIFYEGMQAALKAATIDENDSVYFVEVCYCLEGGLYPMAMEIPTLKEYFESVEVKDGRFRDKCTMECDACDCTRAIKLTGKPLKQIFDLFPKKETKATDFIDFGRIVLNRKKQRVGIEALRELTQECASSKVRAIKSCAAISCIYAIFYDGEYFRVKNIPDTVESRQTLEKMGLSVSESVQSVKRNAKQSLSGNDTHSNIV